MAQIVWIILQHKSHGRIMPRFSNQLDFSGLALIRVTMSRRVQQITFSTDNWTPFAIKKFSVI